MNCALLLPTFISAQGLRSTSFESRYCHDAASALSHSSERRIVGIAELEGLPVPLRNYLVRAGVVGRPRIRNFHAHLVAQMRRNLKADWMDATADQVETFPELSRLFLMRGAVFGVPFDGYHRFVGDSATMQIRVLSLFDIANAHGKAMTAGETVTLFNDMCLLAPATLLDTKIEWRQTAENAVQAKWTHLGNTVTADLLFDTAGDLVNFVSPDRYLSEDGKSYAKYPWSTPVRSYKEVDGRRIPAVADAVWRLPSGNFTYAHFEVQSIEYNVDGPPAGCSLTGR